MDELALQAQQDMNGRIDALKVTLSTLRTGRASPAMLNHIMVDYYGSPTPLNQIANISVQDARMLVVSCWDQSAEGR